MGRSVTKSARIRLGTARSQTPSSLVLLAAVFGLTENRPGKWSIDGSLGRARWGTGWALAALAAGAVGSAAVPAAVEDEAEEEVERPVAEEMLPLDDGGDEAGGESPADEEH